MVNLCCDRVECRQSYFRCLGLWLIKFILVEVKNRHIEFTFTKWQYRNNNDICLQCYRCWMNIPVWLPNRLAGLWDEWGREVEISRMIDDQYLHYLSIGQNFLIFPFMARHRNFYSFGKKKLRFWHESTHFPEHFASCGDKFGPVIRKLCHKP